MAILGNTLEDEVLESAHNAMETATEILGIHTKEIWSGIFVWIAGIIIPSFFALIGGDFCGSLAILIVICELPFLLFYAVKPGRLVDIAAIGVIKSLDNISKSGESATSLFKDYIKSLLLFIFFVLNPMIVGLVFASHYIDFRTRLALLALVCTVGPFITWASIWLSNKFSKSLAAIATTLFAYVPFVLLIFKFFPDWLVLETGMHRLAALSLSSLAAMPLAIILYYPYSKWLGDPGRAKLAVVTIGLVCSLSFWGYRVANVYNFANHRTGTVNAYICDKCKAIYYSKGFCSRHLDTELSLVDTPEEVAFLKASNGNSKTGKISKVIFGSEGIKVISDKRIVGPRRNIQFGLLEGGKAYTIKFSPEDKFWVSIAEVKSDNGGTPKTYKDQVFIESGDTIAAVGRIMVMAKNITGRPASLVLEAWKE